MIMPNETIAIANVRDGAFCRIADIVTDGGSLPGRLVCSSVRLSDAESIIDAFNKNALFSALLAEGQDAHEM